VNFTSKKKPEQAPSAAERRRIGLIVHDERGNASIDWRDAPTDEARPVLEILGERSLAVKSEESSYDPYARARAPRETSRPTGTARTNLRALSAHIKLMRELEERKRRGDDADD
jgi:hypothetical protein